MIVRPDRSTFDALAAEWPLVPVWAELLADVSTPVGTFASLVGAAPGVVLESVERSERWGRYSFVAGDPAAIVTVDDTGVHVRDAVRAIPQAAPGASVSPFEDLKRLVDAARAPRLADLPPLTGGLVGYVGFDAATFLQGHPALTAPGGPPPMAFLFVDRAIVFDHWRQRLLLVAHVGADAGYDAGVAAIEELAGCVAAPPGLVPEEVATAGPSGVVAAVEREEYMAAVERAKEHILDGDIFQVVLSRQIECDSPGGALPIYRRLRLTNPAPYMFLLRVAGIELAGSSPEPLVRVDGRRVTSRPIAGTRRRGSDPEDDLRLERELLADRKERAEHAMLVDLARNDLGMVCVPGTVRPTELMGVERFSRVMHIVSTVEGELRSDRSPLDALAATFPAGTVTGAPKRRAMEIIAELERAPRGPYAGAVGYLTFAGDMDFCITIRTAVVDQRGRATVQAGAGVVADSDPAREFVETEEKASAVLSAMGGRP